MIITPSFGGGKNDGIIVPPLQIYVRKWLELNPEDHISIITIHYPFHRCSYSLFGADIYPMGAANGSILKRPKIWQSAIRKAIQINSQKKSLLIAKHLERSVLVAKKFIAT